jgi:signal transduction histidine kinase
MTAYDRTRRVLYGTFAVIAVLLIGGQLFEHYQTRKVSDQTNAMTANALASVRLVNRVARDLYRERVLVGRHIFESRQVDLEAIERRIKLIKEDYAGAARADVELMRFPGEAALWFQLTTDVALIDGQIASTLALSRQQRDQEAQAELVALDPVYDRVDDELEKLVAINHAATDRAVGAVGPIERRGERLRLAVGLAVLALTLLTTMWVTRSVLRTQREMVRTTAELDLRNRELDAFAARVAHDLRGPLSTIKLAADVATERAPELASTTSIMGRGINQMSLLIEDLLDLSRAGAATGAVGNVDGLASTLVRDLGVMVAEAGGILRYDVAPAWVACSEPLLRQVLWNLGENAVKYRRKDAPLVLEVLGRSHEAMYELRVCDNGMGMSDDDARHAFEPFFRSPRARSIPGTGLGLAIVRRVIEASGGTIRVESTPGQGTTFVIRLPRARAPGPRIVHSASR